MLTHGYIPTPVTPDDVTSHIAEVSDEVQSSDPSEEVPNPNDEHPEEER